MWDDEVSADRAAPQNRGAWRAPSAVLGTRRGVSAIPSVAQQEEADELPVPRRSKMAVAQTRWWWPRSTFGRVLLGTGAFLVVAGAVTLGIVTRNFLVRDAHFRIPGASSIESSGLSEVNRTEVLPVFGEDIGRNIFFVPLGDRRKQLESIPWVQQATVMRYLPDRLSVSIVERTPVAFVRQGNQVELADADGVILQMPPAMMAQHHYSFPVVTGINPQDPASVRRARMAVYQRFVAELDQNSQHLTEQVSEIDVTDPEDLRAVMPEQGSDILAHFGYEQFLHRLEIYKAHIGEWRGRYPKLIGVDLRYNGEVPLEMATDAPGAAATATPARDAGSAAANTGAKSEPATARTATTAQPEKSKAVKEPLTKASIAAHKAAEAKKKALKLKADKARAAHAKAEKAKTAKARAENAAAAVHAASHKSVHPAGGAVQQGQ